MPLRLNDLREIDDLAFDDIIDVRSPAEFAEDHISGAINLPVLSDEERARVGTIYKKESPFKARKIGAALVAANAARHLQRDLADKPGAYRPLVYCWRGGQRSNAFASILTQIGWRAEVLEGGYKSYRRLVAEAVYDHAFPSRIVLLDGDTGSGKTEILTHLRFSGWQVIDLEALARHRGSVLGGYTEAQPSQKAFESRLAAELVLLDPARTVVVEAESAKIGTINLPPCLWDAMRLAPRLVLDIPRIARARYLVRSYSDLSPEDTAVRLRQLHRLHGSAQLAEWQELLVSGQSEDLAMSLMAEHYDPLYRRSRKGCPGTRLALGETALDPERIAETTQHVSAALAQLTSQGEAVRDL